MGRKVDTSPVLLVSRGWDEGEHYTAHFCVSEEKAVWFLHARGCLDSSIFSAFDVESLLGDPGEARIQNSFSRGDPCQGSLFHNEIFMSAGSLLTQGQHIFLFFSCMKNSCMKLIYWLWCSDVIWLLLLLVCVGFFWKRLIIFKNQGLMILPWHLTLLIPLVSLGWGWQALSTLECVSVCTCMLSNAMQV